MKALKMAIEPQIKKSSEIVFNLGLDDATKFFSPVLKTSSRNSEIFFAGGTSVEPEGAATSQLPEK